MSVVHLHNHTQYSLLDGACRVDKILQAAKDYGMPALAMTDHGNMFGAIDFYNTAKKIGVKPIIGIEAYIVNKDFDDETNKTDKRHHLILLAMNEIGYKNLLKLTSKSYLEGFYYKPRINKRLLAEYSEGLICLSACVKGEICSHLVNQQYKQAVKAADWYKSVFGDRYYLELQNHDLEIERQSMPQVIKVAQELSIPLVLTNDCHYINQSHSEAHDILLCIQRSKSLNDPNRMRYETNQLYFRSPEEMKLIYPEVPEAYYNTLEIADRINLELVYNNFLLPEIETPPEYKDMGEYLKALCIEGIKTKYPESTPEIMSRLEYELGVVQNTGFNGYFLVVKDLIDNARKQNVPVGPGRGSGAGSIISYLLDITKVDPLKYQLMFERFLNPDRISMPDIDIDFCAQGRNKVLEYVVQKYGRNSVTQIITYSTLGPKSVIKDVARVLGVSANEANRLTKLIPSQVKSLDEALSKAPEFQEAMNSNDINISVLQHSLVLEGLIRQTGIHAAGVVIVPGDLTDYVPLATGNQKDSENSVLVQYEGKYLEQLKLLKMDFLGLKTLTLIFKAIDLIEAAQNIKIDIDTLPLDDKQTYELLAKGYTDGVFQFESDGMKKYLIELGPNKFEDLIVMVALYRPGPMANIDVYIKRKHGQEKVIFEHPLLENSLKETYGVPVYQEQIMQLSREMGGLSGSEADSLRHAMSKKKADLMDTFRKKFKDGALANNVPEKVIDKIWEDWTAFAEYAFNKSHATCYALVAYQTAWLKAHYPVEFMAALLSLEDNSDKIPYFLEECKRMGVKIVSPNVNTSDCEFTVCDNMVYFGLRAIKNVGESAIKAIVNEREKNGAFKNIFEFCKRLDSFAVNKSVLESLIASGAMDTLEGTRAQKWQIIESAMELAYDHQRENKRGQTLLFDIIDTEATIAEFEPKLPEVENWTYMHQLELEKSVLGFYLTGHPLKPAQELINLVTTPRDRQPEANNSNDLHMIGVVSAIIKKRDNKGNPIAFVEMEDMVGKFEVSLFKGDIDKFLPQLEIGKVFYVYGLKSQYNASDDNAIKLIPKKVIAFDALPYCLKGELSLHLDEAKINAEFIEIMNKIKTQTAGHFTLKIVVKTNKFNTLTLKPQSISFFPTTDFLDWCLASNIKVRLNAISNE
jgi:DNA polymerase-3 subunit alpha